MTRVDQKKGIPIDHDVDSEVEWTAPVSHLAMLVSPPLSRSSFGYYICPRQRPDPHREQQKKNHQLRRDFQFSFDAALDKFGEIVETFRAVESKLAHTRRDHLLESIDTGNIPFRESPHEESNSTRIARKIKQKGISLELNYKRKKQQQREYEILPRSTCLVEWVSLWRIS
jgi:hypothetical protein